MGAIKFGCVDSETHLGGSWCSDKCDLYNDIWGVCTEDWDLQRGYNCPIFGYPAGVYTFDLAMQTFLPYPRKP
jgi:hypothetical protein